MTRWALAVMFVMSSVAMADDALAYTPPAAPAPPDAVGMIARLVGLTAAVLALCAVVLFLARRAHRVAPGKGDPDGRIRFEGSLPLDRRSAVHMLNVEGQSIAVTTDATGLRSMTLLSERFQL